MTTPDLMANVWIYILNFLVLGLIAYATGLLGLLFG
jgi:hypothetical protein